DLDLIELFVDEKNRVRDARPTHVDDHDLATVVPVDTPGIVDGEAAPVHERLRSLVDDFVLLGPCLGEVSGRDDVFDAAFVEGVDAPFPLAAIGGAVGAFTHGGLARVLSGEAGLAEGVFLPALGDGRLKAERNQETAEKSEVFHSNRVSRLLLKTSLPQ